MLLVLLVVYVILHFSVLFVLLPIYSCVGDDLNGGNTCSTEALHSKGIVATLFATTSYLVLISLIMLVLVEIVLYFKKR